MRSFLNIFFIIGVVSVLSLTAAVAADKKKNKKAHRQQEAHMHGAGKMSMAFDGLKGRIEFEIAAESVLGFEYRAEMERDVIILTNATRTFQTDFSNMVKFDSNLGCVITSDKVEQRMDKKKSSHSDFMATYNVECKKTILGSTVQFDFSRYDSIKDIDVTILVDKLQKTLEISNKESSVVLK